MVFAIGQAQHGVALRVVVASVATVFAWPWVAARSLWAPWIAQMLVDVVGVTGRPRRETAAGSD